MANNRMWLVNAQTGQRVLLAKHSQDAWDTPGVIDASTLDERLDDAFRSELTSDRRDGQVVWRGTTDWRIEYESEQPGGI